MVGPLGCSGPSRMGGGKGFLSITSSATPLAHAAACYGAGMAIPFDQREALRMLAGSPNGSTESILLRNTRTRSRRYPSRARKKTTALLGAKAAEAKG